MGLDRTENAMITNQIPHLNAKIISRMTLWSSEKGSKSSSNMLKDASFPPKVTFEERISLSGQPHYLLPEWAANVAFIESYLY